MEVETGNVKQIVYADKTENAFNVAIRTSLEENQRIKERVNVKDEEIDHLRDLNKTLRNQFDALRNEIEIQKLKHMAEVKNIQTANDIDKTTVTNELSSLRKVVTVLDEKFKFLLKEERRKDEFMVGYFKGKIHDPNDKELLVNFFKQFEEVPKMTMSELMAQEHEIQNQLRDEIKRLQERIEVDDIIHKELRRQVEELQKRRY
jgi:protoporphyrinogen oxidase